MSELEQHLHYPFADRLPDRGATIEIMPGVRWIRMSLPFALDHINLWLLRDALDGRDGWTVVDCCIAHEEAQAQWEGIFANELQGLPILRVIVTHMHPDHIGLADWLCARWQVPLYISGTDYHMARLNSSGNSGSGGDAAAEFFTRHGLGDAQAVERIRARSNYYAGLVPAVPKAYRRMMDGHTLRIGGRDWHCISGYGHAPEHIALHSPDAGLLIGGDMMLPRISTNVSVYHHEPESNPLQLFLDSIDKFKPLAGNTLTLPAHGKPFLGLHTRIEQLHLHHRDHLARVMDACGTGAKSAADILPVLFRRKLDAHQITFAMGEAIAHLHKLWFDGSLMRRVTSGGIYRFTPVDT